MRRHAKAIVAVSALLLTLALGVTLAGAIAPVVTIDPASGLSYTSAHVSGTVDPQDQDTFYYFQYSKDPDNEGWSYGPNAFTDLLPAGAGPTAVSDDLTGLKSGTEYFIRLVAENADGQTASAEPNLSFTTDPVAASTVLIDPVTTFTGTTATFTGSINPNAPEAAPTSPEVEAGFKVNWHFECAPECPGLEGGTVAADNSSHVVEADASGLDPNTDYEVTLVAENAGGPVSDGPEGFETDAVAPQVIPLFAGSVDTDSALLGAKINPRNSSVSYQFEWGEDESYGNVAPAIPQALGAQDNALHVVTAPIDGLQSGTTYHFRVLATNTESSQVSQGEDRALITLEPTGPEPACDNTVFRVGPSAGLPDCRAYEMVSPVDKNGGDVEIDQSARAADAGADVTYSSYSDFGGGGSSGGYINQILSTRTPSGWVTRGINPPLDPPFYGVMVGLRHLPYAGFSSDLSVGVVEASVSDGVSPPPFFNLLSYDVAKSAFTVVSRPFAPLPAGQQFTFTKFSGASDDFSHIVFESDKPLTPDAPLGLAGQPNAYLYHWSDGELKLVSIFPAEEGGGPTGSVALGRGSVSGFDLYPGDHAVSDDGSRIFFVSPASAASGTPRVYVRVDDPSDSEPATTMAVSQSERTSPEGRQEALFQMASADGSKAFLVSDEKLTNDSHAEGGTCESLGLEGLRNCHRDLYLWDASEPAGQRLIDLTAGASSGGGVAGVVSGARDGSVVYFVGAGVLAAGAIQGSPNLYVWDAADGIRFIGTLDESAHPYGAPTSMADEGVWTYFKANGPDGRWRDARVSPDGQQLLFRSRARLTAYDNAGSYQIYMYDQRGGQEFLTCVSCNPRTQASTGDAWLKRRLATRATPADALNAVKPPTWLQRNLGSDGSVFFDSAEALVTADTNGKIDVYEWDEGDLSLISSGQSADDSAFLDASASGRDVFFVTRSKLTGQDIGEQADLYDARIGGGFPEPPKIPPCQGDACQPPPVIPSDPSPSSASFKGAGNTSSARCTNRKVKRNGRCVKRNKRKHRARADRNRGAVR